MKIKFRSVLSVIMTIGILFLCSCNSVNRPDDSSNVYSDEQNNRFDTVYSLFQYFKTSFDEFWDNLRIEYTGEDTSYKIPSQASELNWCISAILYEIDELDENAPFSSSAKKEIHTAFEDLSDSASLVAVQTLEKSSFAMTFKSNLNDSVERVIKMLDNTYFEELPSKNLLSIDVIKEKTDYTVYVYITLEDEQSYSTEEQDERISDTFDKVLASGSDDNGDLYELVANEAEDYNGVSVEIGIIKNNQWLLEPTSNMPFVDDDGSLYGKQIQSIYDENANFFYIGNGCFLCESYSESMYECMENMLYNAETKQSYEKKFKKQETHICITYNCLTSYYGVTPDYSNQKIIDKEDSLIITDMVSYRYTPTIEILDTNTMTASVIEIKIPDNWYGIGYVYPISEGIFAVADECTNHNKITFYDKDGNRIIQNDFVLQTTRQSIAFEDSECTFNILNANDTPYTITIDKSGNVLSSVQIK